VSLTKGTLTLVLALTLIANVADFFGTFGFVWMVLKASLRVDNYFAGASELLSLPTWMRFTGERGVLAFAAASIFASFSLGKREGKRIFGMAQNLFPRSRIPRELSGVRMAVMVPVVVFGYLLNLFLMAYFIENAIILPALVALVYLLSIVSNTLQRTNLKRHLVDSRYSPSPQSEDYAYIMKSRDILSTYLYHNYHQVREIIALTGCLAIAFLAWKTEQAYRWLPYILISVVVLFNELVVYRWRNRRDVALLALDQ